jgi:hypothetical protein
MTFIDIRIDHQNRTSIDTVKNSFPLMKNVVKNMKIQVPFSFVYINFRFYFIDILMITVTYPGNATSASNLWFVIRWIDLLDKFKL